MASSAFDVAGPLSRASSIRRAIASMVAA